MYESKKKREEGVNKKDKKRGKLSFHMFYKGTERNHGGMGRNYLSRSTKPKHKPNNSI